MFKSKADSVWVQSATQVDKQFKVLFIYLYYTPMVTVLASEYPALLEIIALGIGLFSFWRQCRLYVYSEACRNKLLCY